jgi:phytoene dehydrogenase-like protein
MTQRTYDAIIIGGGCQGLCLAAYLQRAGLQVAIFERRHEEGGPVWSWESVAPGFVHNHAQLMEFLRWMPFSQDFEFEKLGFRSVYPEVQAGIAFSDGRPPIVLYGVEVNTEENFERTHRSIAVYSKHDADTFVDLKRKALALEGPFLQWWYNPPAMPSAQDPDPMITFALQLMHVFGVPAQYAQGSAKELIDALFESPEMRTLLYKMAPEWTCPLETPGMGAFALLAVWGLSLIWRLCVGGTHTLAHAMVMAAVKEGVHFHEASEVKKILVENGRAVGARLADGTEVRARKLVASNADTRQTLLDLVGEEKLSPLWVRRARDFKYGHTCVVGYSHFAVHEAPRYKSARHNPDMNRAFYMVAGFDAPEEVVRQMRDIDAGKLPGDRGLAVCVNSLFDPSYAPPGKHSLLTALFFPPASSHTREQWREVKATYNDLVLDQLQRWAPNMTRANVIADRFTTPLDFEEECRLVEGDFCNGSVLPDQLGHNRPFPEAAQYRTEIAGLYLCGPGQHPLGAVSCGPGYNAYKVIASDLNLGYRPWAGNGRGY